MDHLPDWRQVHLCPEPKHPSRVCDGFYLLERPGIISPHIEPLRHQPKLIGLWEDLAMGKDVERIEFKEGLIECHHVVSN